MAAPDPAETALLDETELPERSEDESGAGLAVTNHVTVEVSVDEYEQYRRSRDAQLLADTDQDPVLRPVPDKVNDDGESGHTRRENVTATDATTVNENLASEPGAAAPEPTEGGRSEDDVRDPDPYFDRLGYDGSAATEPPLTSPSRARPGSATIDSAPLRAPRHRSSRSARTAPTRMARRPGRRSLTALAITVAIAGVAVLIAVAIGAGSDRHASTLIRAGLSAHPSSPPAATAFAHEARTAITAATAASANAAKTHAAAQAKADKARAKAAAARKARKRRAARDRKRHEGVSRTAPQSSTVTSTSSTTTYTTPTSTSSTVPSSSGSSGQTTSSQPTHSRHPYGVGGLLSIGSSPSG